jgi:3-hydroxyisobutyrate dehydrogenase-like beta-hydroxyacid dehydrogenase
MSRVAVVGLGAMGSRIAVRLLRAGHEVVVWNRTPAKAAALAEQGATVAETPAAAAERAEAVITMLADPAALAHVTEGSDGVAAGAREGLTVLEMSTVGPEAVARLERALPDGVGLLDAPVLGSLTEVESGSLGVFVGGPDDLVARWLPLLSDLGRPLHVGPLGAGAAAKLVANSTLLGTLGVIGEALALARKVGLSSAAAFEVLTATPLAQQAERRRPVVEGEEVPVRFRLELARKDAELVTAAGAELRLAAAVRTWLEEADDAGWGDRDYGSLVRWIAEPSS